MPRQYSTGKPDKNKRLFVEYFERRGCHILHMREGQGFDLLVIVPVGLSKHAGPQIVEIKNPDDKWKLTEAETAMQAACKERGVHYWIFETVEQVQERML